MRSGLAAILTFLAACGAEPAPAGDDVDAGVVPDGPAAVVVDAAPDAPPIDVTPVAAARPAIAFDGDSHLVVWDTTRNGTSDIYGTRVSATGVVLDPDGLAIASAPGIQIAPRIAWNGQVYLVVWKDTRLGSSAIFAARVDRAGQVLDPGGLTVVASGGTTQFPAVASDGHDFLVVWEGPCSDASCVHGISAATVSATGVVGAARRIAQPAALSYTPAVAFGGGTYLVTWAEIAAGVHDIHGRTVAPGGSLGPDLVISAAPSNQIVPAVASDGAGFLVVWQDTRAGVDQTYGARLAGGAVLDPAGILLSAAARFRDGPSVARDGDGYLVAWTEASGADVVLATRRVTSGGVAGAPVVACTTPSVGSPVDDDQHPALAPAGGGAALTWQTHWDVASTVKGGELSAASQTLGRATLLSTAIVR